MSSSEQTNSIAAIAQSGVAARTRETTRLPCFKLLVALFVLSLPMVNPWVRGDGVGYYAYVRSSLIDHSLHFENDWLAANPSFREERVDSSGHLLAEQYSRTGYVKNHFSIGPSILWAPFLAATHGIVLGANFLGARIPADGFSLPYLVTMAVTTALYGFSGLLLSFDLARKYFEERWALLATLGIWFATSLPVYMYFNPSWSHAHSAFAVALFLWYWHRTRDRRSLRQWLVLGLCAGLMMNVYYPNAILLLVPTLEALSAYGAAVRQKRERFGSVLRLAAAHVSFLLLAGLALLPTFIVRRILSGSFFDSDYPALRNWFWTSPVLWRVLFSADHGMLSWTPILIPALVGLVLFRRRDPVFGTGLLVSFVAFYYFIASYPSWDGISSFGNRFFVSLTPLFVVGLAAFLDFLARKWKSAPRCFAAASSVIGLLILWNGGLAFQWGTSMIPARGPISWRQTIHNQYAAVPQKIGGGLETYLLRRTGMMQRIEERDLKTLQFGDQEQ